MIRGQYALPGSTVLSQWFDRRADQMVIAVETIALQDGGSLASDLRVETKNREEPDPTGASGEIGSPVDLTSVDVHYGLFGGVKEQYRYKITTTGSATDYVFIQVASPAWFAN